MRKTLARLTVVVVLGLNASPLEAQYVEEERGYWRQPIATTAGILVTDNEASALLLISGDSIRTLVKTPGCGNQFVLSPDRRRVGFKLIDVSGRQAPAILDLDGGTLQTLESYSPRVGQPSFADDGTVAYTIGEDLIVRRGTGTVLHPLGCYANCAPLSPNGKRVAFNTPDDQIWILDLEDGSRTKVSDGPVGYFDPKWSPDGMHLFYSSLSGDGYVYDCGSGTTALLGEARSATWMPDSRTLLFHRLTIEGPQLKNADIFAGSWDGSAIRNITSTPDGIEMDASFDPATNSILYQSYSRQEVLSRRISVGSEGIPQMTPQPFRVILARPPEIEHVLPATLRKTSVPATLDIPYVHQCYDTPDWHNGNGSCAPTAAMMVLAYYGILPPWPTYCSTPKPHWNDWGGYVADKYQYREVNYASCQTTDYGGNITWGAYGYMWKFGSPHTRMAGFYQNNGMTTSQTESTPHDVALAEIQAGRPFTMCVMLTSAGHLIISHGVGAEAHTFVFNDPYGNKNQGYKNYNGKNVQYDWPGYNNGHQNLTGVAWCIATTYTPSVQADSVVDDAQIEKGFHLQTATPASMTLWGDANSGIGGHSWYTTTTTTDGCYATWTPQLPKGGKYDVQAYVPAGSAATGRYVITHDFTTDTVAIDQAAHADTWVSLGTYDFRWVASVRLGSGSPTAGSRLGFDAVRWTYKGLTGIASKSIPTKFAIKQNYPNPFNPSTRIAFEIAEQSDVLLEVVDILGRKVEVLVDQSITPGSYAADWNARASASGVYFAVLRARTVSGTNSHCVQKMMLVR